MSETNEQLDELQRKEIAEKFGKIYEFDNCCIYPPKTEGGNHILVIGYVHKAEKENRTLRYNVYELNSLNRLSLIPLRNGLNTILEEPSK